MLHLVVLIFFLILSHSSLSSRTPDGQLGSFLIRPSEGSPGDYSLSLQ